MHIYKLYIWFLYMDGDRDIYIYIYIYVRVCMYIYIHIFIIIIIFICTMKRRNLGCSGFIAGLTLDYPLIQFIWNNLNSTVLSEVLTRASIFNYGNLWRVNHLQWIQWSIQKYWIMWQDGEKGSPIFFSRCFARLIFLQCSQRLIWLYLKSSKFQNWEISWDFYLRTHSEVSS